MEMQLPIREFIYFDREKVEDFVSALLGGLPAESKEAGADKSPRWLGRFDLKILGGERRGRTQEISWEEIRRATPASLFERLYQSLRQNNAIEILSPFDAERWNELKVGNFIEVPAKVEFSALEMLLDLIRGWAPLIEKLGFKQEAGSDWDKVITYINELENLRDTYNIRVTPLGAPYGFILVAILPKDKVRGSKEELIGDYTVFGRVQRKLNAGETFLLVDLVPGIKLPVTETQQFLSNLQTLPSILGPPPSRNDLIVSYPAIILTPIAIYR